MKREKPTGLRSNDKNVKPSKKLKVRITSDDQSPSEAGKSKEANNTPVYPSGRVTRAKAGGETSETTKSISNGKKAPGKREKAAELKSPVIKSARKKGEISADNKGQKTLPEGAKGDSTKITTRDIAEEAVTLLMHLSGENDPLNPVAETPQSFAPLSPETTCNQEDMEANADTTVRRKTGRPDKVKRQAKLPETPLGVSNENGDAISAAVDASKDSMAPITFADEHNQVAYLQKSNEKSGPVFHQIVDFLNTTHIRYALLLNPTIYISQIKQFWTSAQSITIETRDTHETVDALRVTVDRATIDVTEASLRRILQLDDLNGIITLPMPEIHTHLSSMGYDTTDKKATFKKSGFCPHWRFLIHTLLHCLSPKKTSYEQFSSTMAYPLVCLATDRTFNWSNYIFQSMQGNVKSSTKFLMYPRFVQAVLNEFQLQPHTRVYKIRCLKPKVFQNMNKDGNRIITPLFLQMLAKISQVQNSPIITVPNIDYTPPVSHTYETRSKQPTSLITTQHVPDPFGLGTSSGGSRLQPSPTREESEPLPHDSPLPTGHTVGSVEGSGQQMELMDMCTKLARQVESLQQDLAHVKKQHAKDLTHLKEEIQTLKEELQRPKQTRKAAKRLKHVPTPPTEPLIAPIQTPEPTTQEPDEVSFVTVAQMKTVMSTAIAHVNEQIEKAVADHVNEQIEKAVAIQFEKYLASQPTTSQPTTSSTPHPNTSGPQHNYKDFEFEELKQMMLAHMLDQPELRNAKPALFGYLYRGADLERTCTTNVLLKRSHGDPNSVNHEGEKTKKQKTSGETTYS